MTQQERDEIRALVLSFSTKISDLPEVEALQDGDYVVVVQNDGSKKHSKKATLESLLELIKVYYPDHNGAKYQGVAHPSDTNVQVPVGTDGFWFAIDAGVYTNYGGITVTNAPKALFYNTTTHEWSGEELWGDINGTVGFRLITGTAENSLDTFKIPVIAGRDYIISALAKPTGTFATLNIYEYNYNGTLINTTGYHVPEHSFVPRPGVDYIKISLGYNSSNPIDASLSEVRISSSIRNLVEGITNFVVDVLQGDYETRIDNLENYVEGAIGNLTTNLGALTARVGDAEGNITDLQVDALGIHADIENAQGDILNLDVRADALELDMTNAQGDILDLDVRASGISTRLENAEGDIDELSITAEGLEQRVTNAEGDVHTLQSTATTLESQITATDGRVSTLRQTVDEIDARVENAEGDVAGLAIEAHRIDLYAQSINESLGDYEAYANGIMEGLQDQLDGVVDTYFYDYMPVHEDATGAPDSQVPLIEITIEGVTVPCEPYASWYNTDHGGTAQEVNTERLKHLGDVFYDNKSGYAFRFSNTGTEQNPVFAWVEIQDSAVIKALADAAKAQDTADHKRRVFVYSVTYPTPYAPYDVGDLWVKPVTVGTGASAQNTTELYRCVTARERTTDVFPFNPAVNTDTTSDYCDWEPADGKAEIVTKSNLQVLSDAIVGQTTQIVYNDDGTISSQSTASIQTTAGQIRLNVANGAIDTAVGPNGKITTPLLGTGIDIINGDITLIANHISLKNQSDITGLELITIGESPNQKVVIDVGSLNVSGIFTTSAWDNSSLVNPGVKQQLLASAAGTAEQMLGTALYGSGGTQQQPTGGVYKALNPITTALTENTTVIAGGLMMSTALVLGGLTGPDDSQGNPTWEPWSGMFGVYDPTVGAGGGVAAWYGGTNVDAFTIPNWDTMTDVQKAAAWSQYRYARTLFRMDGSGYLANGEISWSDQGSLVIHGASIESTVLENSVTFGSTQITIQDIIELKSWFVKESYTDGQGNTRYAIKLATGTAAGTIAGFYTDGFISAGGLSSGGGASGTTIEAVWGTLTNDTPATPTTTTKIAAAHIPIGSGLEIQNGVIVVTAQGTVTGIKIGSTTYTPASGSTTVDISAGIPTVPTAVSAFTNDAGYITSSDIPSSWAWSAITNTPTTLSGYGITDATISNGVVTLGSSTITPVTGVAIGGSGHTNDLAITAGGSTSYITVPFATTASKLSTVSKTAWGQTYWTSGGVPDSISGNMSSVGNITMTGSISGATTISASSSVTSPIFYLNANTYFVLDSSGYVHLVTPSGKGFYCDGFVSAGGISTGGGTGGIDLAAMWASLQNNDNESTYHNRKIDIAHLPDVVSGSGLSITQSGSGTSISTSIGVASGYSLLTNSSQTIAGLKSFTTGIKLDAGADLELYPTSSDDTGDIVWRYYNGNEKARIWFAGAYNSAVGPNYRIYSSNGTNLYTGRLATMHDIPTVSGVYLPLSAGSGQALTGALYANNDIVLPITRPANTHIYDATAVASGYTLNGTVTDYASFLSALCNTKSYLGSVNVQGSGTWYNVISVRHRNGSDDGRYYGMVIYSYLTERTENLYWNRCTDDSSAASWQGERKILDSANYSSVLGTVYAPYNSNGYLPLIGGTISGNLIISSSSETDWHTKINGASSAVNITYDGYGIEVLSTSTSSSKYLFKCIYGQNPLYTGGSTALIIRCDGNVGIGTASPSEKLEVGGIIKSVPGANETNIRLQPNTSAYSCIRFANSQDVADGAIHYFAGTSGVTGVINLTSSTGISIGTWNQGNQQMYWDATNYRLGICTNAPTQALDVNGSMKLNGSINFTNSGAFQITDYGNIYATTNTDSDYWCVRTYGGNFNAFTVNAANGFIGMGTKNTSSYYRLYVDGSAQFTGDVICPISRATYENSVVVSGSDLAAAHLTEAEFRSALAATRSYLGSTVGWGGWKAVISVRHRNGGSDGDSYGFCIYENMTSGGHVDLRWDRQMHSGWQGSWLIWDSYNAGNSGADWLCYNLTAYNNITANGAITAGSASDMRLKENIVSMNGADAKSLIMNLRPVTYRWNALATSLYDKYEGEDVGFVAQEVQPYMPVAISTIFEKYMRLDQTKFIAPLVSVAQDHELRIRELEAKCARLEAENNELKRINAN